MSDSNDPSSSSRYFKLGLFMLIGVGVIVTGIIVLGAGALFNKTVPAETLVYESVNGLDVGSAVKYRGVPIGKVTEIIFSSVKYKQATTEPEESSDKASNQIRGILIEMALNERAFPGETHEEIINQAQQLIEKGLRARVTPAGISGQSYVDFDILDPADHPAPPISFKPNILYVPSAPSAFGQVIDAASQIASELEKANLGKIARHIDDLATQATGAVAEVKQLLATNKDNFNRTIAELPDTSTHLRETVARADEIMHDPRVDKAIDKLSGVGDSANAALADLRQLVNEASALLAGESDDLRSIITDLRRLASDGAAFVSDARQNPSRVLFGKPPPPDGHPLQNGQ